MKRKLITTGLLAGAILSYSSSIFADTRKFPDVPKWAEQSVNYLVDKQVLIGYPDGTFGSNVTLDRASAATIITKALGIEIEPKAKPSFTDSQDHWGAPYIAAAEKAGIIKGEGNGLFNPSGKVTRAAMATMLVNAYKLQSTTNDNGQSKFEDLKGHWGEKYANILIDLKISNGTDNGWQPNRFITRAEAAQLTAKTDILSREMNSELKEKDYTNTNILLNQHQKRSGKVIEKTEEGLVVSDENSSVYAMVSSPDILRDIQIGDTVTIYAPMFIGSIPGDPATAKYAIVQKENEENVLKKQYEMHTGSIINKTKDTIEISSEGSTVSATVSSEVLQDINIGDTVTIYGASFMSNMATGKLSAKAPIIEKLTSKTATTNTSVDKSKSISEVDKKEQNALDQHQKLSGKVIEKTEDGLVVSGKNSSVYAMVSSPEVLKDIQIGDTVTIYAPMFIGSIPGEPDTAKYAIVQKENEENVLKKQYKMHTGSVINRTKETVQISSEGLTVTAVVSSEVLEDIQVGDTVTIYGASFMSNMATGELSAKAPIIEKLAK
ncbi:MULTISPECIES: S-layer homology domain-containing protein [Bacillus cereus group]|uniref:S-layer homology domain-containing protein n=1 Tax=Bacillus cereus group TaxID=86661 RepID=UPI000E6BECCB|nr:MULTISPECIES: S-layer homology domain-containing protein [Bacillus cereus group]MDC7729853.1 S-layer homology domain-containing protein [Bacillus cereus]RJE11100.1 S-layer protein [Bacillus cereus]TNO86363.1 S-layer homology domain-containing protein [Bacillus cereus]USL10926.1 S-layer homology domain-containing protein [Bacillus bombysepticus]